MARIYKLETQRPGGNAVLYYHGDGTLELTDPDSGMAIDYLQSKLNISKDMFAWMAKYGVTSVECTKV